MKNISSLLAFSLALVAVATGASSTAAAATPDSTLTRQLDSRGEVAVQHAGPYVEVGSYRIWVYSHLGRPSTILPNGTYLYTGRAVEGSSVTGTLAVAFDHGQVSSLKLLSDVRVAQLRSAASHRIGD